jgi:phosphate transport system substrate-binding protein
MPLALEFARQHLGFSDAAANSFVHFSTTHFAYVNLILKRQQAGGDIYRDGDAAMFLNKTHPVDLIIATGASEEELDLAQQHDIELIQKPVCYDAFVFITHKDNPVESLTLEQVRGIYSGTITNWNEVGGDDAPIIAYQREENSGSQSGMIDLVMKDTPMLPPETVPIVGGMGPLVDAVAEYQNNSVSIGYTYKYYIDNLYKDENIKILQIEGIAADEEHIKAESYPLTTCYYGVIRAGEESATAGRFLDWIRSAEGQACVAQAGYIPFN